MSPGGRVDAISPGKGIAGRFDGRQIGLEGDAVIVVQPVLLIVFSLAEKHRAAESDRFGVQRSILDGTCQCPGPDCLVGHTVEGNVGTYAAADGNARRGRTFPAGDIITVAWAYVRRTHRTV